ncbi:MAG: peptidoglycan-binding domain-containing protein [Gammaproteobacteria bacterium]|nr:peptidoglycan-binding domain-containing protein [Gammaproteobacteria bacterium]
MSIGKLTNKRYCNVITLALALALGGCGTTPEERGLSGAGVGAGAGAIVGAVTGLSVVQGALLGATAGGLTGALTKKDQIDLGEPAWKRSQNSAKAAGTGNGTVARIQSGLARLGYDPGEIDGAFGPRTEQAIRKYQKDHGLLVDGRPTPELAAHIGRQSG